MDTIIHRPLRSRMKQSEIRDPCSRGCRCPGFIRATLRSPRRRRKIRFSRHYPTPWHVLPREAAGSRRAKLALRGRGWRVPQQTLCQWSKLMDPPPPTPPHHARARAEGEEITAHDSAISLLVSREVWPACSALFNQGAGNAGRPMRPIAACATIVVVSTRVVRSHRHHPAFPTQWFTAYFVLFPAIGFFVTVIPEKLASQELDASTEASEPHDFAVRLTRHSSKAHPRPPHPVPRPRRSRAAPLWDRTGRVTKVICVF